MKILAVLLRDHGDICIGSTVIHAIKSKCPESEISVFTEEKSKNIWEGNPDIKNIIIGKSYFEAIIEYKKGGYDKFYKMNMANQPDTCWHHTVGQQNQHLGEWYAKRAELDSLDDKNIYIYPSNNDVNTINEIMKPYENDKIVAFHTTTGRHGDLKINSRDWPIQYFNAVAERIARKGYRILQAGGPEDRLIELDPKVGEVINLNGKLTFKQSALVYKKCVAFVGLDSGPAYLVGWAGIPSIVVMGATTNKTKEFPGPASSPRMDNIHYINPKRPDNTNCKPIPCQVNCLISKPGGCIIDVPVEEVYGLLVNLLGVQ